MVQQREALLISHLDQLEGAGLYILDKHLTGLTFELSKHDAPIEGVFFIRVAGATTLFALIVATVRTGRHY